jgi:hypothetical protein
MQPDRDAAGTPRRCARAHQRLHPSASSPAVPSPPLFAVRRVRLACLLSAGSTLSALFVCALLGGVVTATACGRGEAAASGADSSGAPTAEPGGGAADPDAARERERQAMLDRDWPMHGLVTGLQLVVRKEPSPESTKLGWLRIGARLRLKRESTRTPTCATGWHAIYPQGYACAGEGVQVSDAPPDSPLAVPPAGRDEPLPYAYYMVKDALAASYHQLPSRDDQRDSDAFAARYAQLAAADPAKALRFLRGELPNEPRANPIVKTWLQRGFYVAGAGIDVRSQRRFVRTVRGQYVKEQQLERRRGSSFRGVALGEGRSLPVAWVIRGGPPMRAVTLPDGSTRFADDREAPPLERLTVVGWKGRRRFGDRVLHELEDGHFVRDWFLAVAEKVDRPRGVREDEPWVHVSVGSQTLVVYRGDVPVYATLVSTGLEGHDTPRGLFTIREKHVSDTMSNIGADATSDRYAIEDVPWTQYFSGSIALHAAFWHERFGLRRSHGCVNLAPADAHAVFDLTWPTLPEGWHGITTDRTGLRGSHVLVTD